MGAKKKNKGGRPTKRDEIAEALILGILRTGLSYETAAEAAKIDKTTLHRWRKEDPDFDLSCRAAMAGAKAGYGALLMKAARQGDVRAITFFLKTRTKEFREQRGDLAHEQTAEDRAKAIRETLLKMRSATLDGAGDDDPGTTDGPASSNGTVRS